MEIKTCIQKMLDLKEANKKAYDLIEKLNVIESIDQKNISERNKIITEENEKIYDEIIQHLKLVDKVEKYREKLLDEIYHKELALISVGTEIDYDQIRKEIDELQKIVENIS